MARGGDMAIEDVATKVENNGDGTCTWRVNFNMTIDEQMFAQMSAKAVALPISSMRVIAGPGPSQEELAAEAMDWRQQCMGKVATEADVEQERKDRLCPEPDPNDNFIRDNRVTHAITRESVQSRIDYLRAHGYIDNEVDAGPLEGFTRGGCIKVNGPGHAALLDPSDTTHETLSADEPMDLLELQRRCNASSSRLADGSATFAHIRAQRAQADLVASIRSEWDNLPDAEPAGILKR